MPPPKLITDEMMPEVLRLAGQGKSAAEIAAWLESERGVKVSGSAVHKRLGKVAKERAPIAQAIVREKLSATIGSDLDAVQGVLDRAADIESSAHGSGEFGLALKAQDRQLRALELRFKLSGANPDPDQSAGLIILPARKTDDEE